MKYLWIGLCALLTACVAEVEDTASHEATLNVDALRNVVIARMYQRDVWTLPQADSYHPELYPTLPERRIAYVCDALSFLYPTYVSGLIRLDATQEITAEQAAIYHGVKQCVRGRMPKGHHVKFDVALNALHYTDPHEGVPNADEGARMIRRRLNSANDALKPDGWFFDFYTHPWKDDRKRFPEAMEAGIRWIHDGERKHFVGGNTWGPKVPKGSDFISITDRGGMTTVSHLMSSLKDEGVPVLMHIRNDPDVPGSEGLLWIQRDRTYRKSVLRRHVNGQSMGYKYMYPAFFPLDEQRHAYDVMTDGNMLERMCEYIRGGSAKCSTSPALNAKLADDSDEQSLSERWGIHRAYHAGNQQHLYSISLLEIESAQGLTLEYENFFYLDGAQSAGTVPFYRCYLGNGWHLLTAAPGCEGAAGAVDEGVLGYIASSEQSGTVPLYRLFRGAVPDHFYTTNAGERDYAVSLGYVDEGIVGWVWTTP